nr:M24 family metallopeptidase [Mycoplasmopsis cynos]
MENTSLIQQVRFRNWRSSELPSVSSRSQTILKPGMIITVEPGIYIEGLGGARIEDDVLVTENGHYVFSRPEETNEKPF